MGLEESVKRSFSFHLRKSFNHVPGEVGDLESKWTTFCVNQCCGHKLVGVGHGGNTQIRRWPQAQRDAVKQKKELYWVFLDCVAPEAEGRYRQARRSAAMAFGKAKTWAWEQFGEDMENNFRMASKRLWTTIWRLSRGKQCTVNTG